MSRIAFKVIADADADAVECDRYKFCRCSPCVEGIETQEKVRVTRTLVKTQKLGQYTDGGFGGSEPRGGTESLRIPAKHT